MVAPSEKFRRKARSPRKSRVLALALVGEYTHTLGHGPEEAMTARQTLADLLALASERDRIIVRMRVEGYSTAEIAARVGCAEGSARRHLRELHARSQAAGIVEPAAIVAVEDRRGAMPARQVPVPPRDRIAARRGRHGDLVSSGRP